jgi:rhodanese-related sulfurtransferase
MEIRKCRSDELARLLECDGVYACIDVRERGEFALEQIAETTPLARGTLEYRVQKMIPSKSVPVVVCCDDGRRSELAALTLSQMGYRDVQLLAGGLAAWKKSGLATRQGWGVGGKEYGEKIAITEVVPHITAENLSLFRRRGEKVVVVDVRTEEEYLRGHVPGAVNVPGGQLLLQIPELLHNDDSLVVVSCAGRTRGILGAQLLREAGIRNACALLNGAMGWRLTGYELEVGPSHHQFGNAGMRSSPWVEEATRRLAKNDNVRSVPCEEVKQIMASEKIYYLIDVRLPKEFRSEHVNGSINLPMGQIALAYENFIAVRQATLFVVADDEIRSVWAAALFQRLGFRNVLVVKGGIQAMAEHGFSLEDEKAETEMEVFGLADARMLASGLVPTRLREYATTAGSVVILDVRGSGEYASGHIQGAHWLARGKLELGIHTKVSDKARKIVTVCDSGIRSSLAAGTLKSLGYRDVSYLEGGLRAWQREGIGLQDGLDGADVTREEAQADFGHTLWTGALGKSEADMKRYLSWEESLGHKYKQGG